MTPMDCVWGALGISIRVLGTEMDRMDRLWSALGMSVGVPGTTWITSGRKIKRNPKKYEKNGTFMTEKALNFKVFLDGKCDKP